MFEQIRQLGQYDFFQQEDGFGLDEVLSVLQSPSDYAPAYCPASIFVLAMGNLSCEAQLYFSKKGDEARLGMEVLQIHQQENGLLRFISAPLSEPYELEIQPQWGLAEMEDQMWQALEAVATQDGGWIENQLNLDFEVPRMCSFRWG